MESRFERSGYGRQSIGFGARPAVLVVDFQYGFTSPDYPLGTSPHVQSAVENTARLLASARSRGIPVASCNVAWRSAEDMSFWKITPLYDGHFFVGHEATRFDHRIHDPDYDFTFTKSAPSIFFQTPLSTYLTRQQVDTVLVTGCTTSGCVRASIVDAFSHGYRTLAVEDCCGDMERGEHEANLRDVGRRYADVFSLQQVLDHIEARFPVQARTRARTGG